MVRSKSIRTVGAVIAIILPDKARRLLYRRILGYEISPTAKLGRSLVIVDRLIMEDGSSIGHFNLIRGCEELHLERHATIGIFVWIYGVSREKPYFAGQDREVRVLLKAGAAITALHIIDCCDKIEIGVGSILAGFRTQVLTHGVDILRGLQVARPVTVGDYVFVATGSILLAGADIPSYSQVAAGAVVRGTLKETYTLYAGNPATAVRPISRDARFFDRAESHIY